MKTVITKLQQLKKSVTANEAHQQGAYGAMLQSLIEECIEKSEQIADCGEQKQLPIQFIQRKKEWQQFMEAGCRIIESWLPLKFEVIRKTKRFEALEDLMAEVDDWIEETAEEEGFEHLGLSYMENWDIGVFFE